MLASALLGLVRLPNPDATAELGAELAAKVVAGETVLLSGPLGAGKTCLVRGFLRAKGFSGTVPSPTFNLVVVYDLDTRIVHADFYRLASAAGTGIEDELGESICLVEWPDRLGHLVDPAECWQVDLGIEGDIRTAQVRAPQKPHT